MGLPLSHHIIQTSCRRHVAWLIVRMAIDFLTAPTAAAAQFVFLSFATCLNRLSGTRVLTFLSLVFFWHNVK